MGAGTTRCIMELSKEDCWSLFAKYAFHDGNSDAYPELEAIGKQIVENCKGLPLAIKAIGALLQSKLDVAEWDKILRSELWDLSIEETGILPALGLSYKYLSPNLKRCFAYCSIFPKDYAFQKDKLILLWMAEGFLPQPKNKTMEEVGEDYFLALVSRSLFQRSNSNEYKMHDLVIDLAKFISKQFVLSHEDDCSHEIGSNTRHFSYYCKNFHIMKLETFHEAKRLRTIWILHWRARKTYKSSGIAFYLELQNVESLTDAKNVNLRDMKYLEKLVLKWIVDTNASESHIIVLDSLQPHSNLKSLAINGYGGKSFPNWVGSPSLSNITSLHLQNCNHCCSLPPLGQLPSLQDLSIVGLDGVVIVGREFYGSGSCSMKPFGALKVLKFENMFKWEEWFSFEAEMESFPLDLFSNLRHLEIWCCGNLESLTVREQHKHDLLLSLIDIKGCPNFVHFPNGGLHAPSLEEFGITNCQSLPSLPNKMHILLPSLKKLHIQDCPEVDSFPKGGLPSSLNEIHIDNCEKLFASRMGWGLQKLPSVRRFKICGKSEDVESFPEAGLLPTSLTYLCIKFFSNLKYLDKKGLQHLTALEKLEIRSCPKLEFMPEDGLPTSLSTMNIFFCPLLKKECKKKEGKEWRKIAHIIDDRMA
ncbi:hypothetical protein SLA2020_429620 [Shorea laevis]